MSLPIKDLYKLQIDVVKQTAKSTSYYNVNIDATDVLVIGTITDFNNNPISGVDLCILCDKGKFTKVSSGVTGSPDTDPYSYELCDAITDSKGQICGLYTASEWGLCTFSLFVDGKDYYEKICINVTGWRNVQTYNSYSTLKVNEEKRLCQLYYHRDGLSGNATATGVVHYGVIGSKYSSPGAVGNYNSHTNVLKIYLKGVDLMYATNAYVSYFNISWNVFLWTY